MDYVAGKHWWDLWQEGFEYEEWDELAQDEYRAYCDLKREEQYDRDLGLYDERECVEW